MLVNFSKKIPFWWKWYLGHNLDQNYAVLSDDLLTEKFFEVLQYNTVQQVDNSSSQISKKILRFAANGQFAMTLGKSFAALIIMIRSKGLFEMLGGMTGHNSQAEVTIIFPKKFPYGYGYFWQHDSSMIGYYWQINFTFKFTKKFLFEKNLTIWGQLGPRLYNLIFLKNFIMIVHNKLMKAREDNLHKNFTLGKMSRNFVENPVFTF